MQRIARQTERVLKAIYNITEERYPDLVLRTEVIGGTWFSMIGFLTYILYIPLFLYVFTNKQAALSLLLIGIPTTLMGVVIMRRSKNLYLASVVAGAGGGLNMVAISAVSGGAWSMAFAWIPLTIISSFLLTTSRTGIYMTLLFATLSGGVAAVVHPVASSDWGFEFPIFGTLHVIFNAGIQFGSLLWVGYFAYIFKTKQSAALLESEIAKRNVRALLDHIPQGVLSIEAGGKISNEFSAHMTDVLGETPKTGVSFKELVLDRCHLGSDEKDQAWQTILASAGEHAFNFDINANKLPNLLQYRNGESEKYLKVTWNAVIDQEIVRRILVTFLDITDEKALEKETEAQKHVLDLIQELLNVPAGKISQFFSTTIPLLNENLRMVENESIPLTESSVRMLFVNAHTVKGAARTLQLKDLAQHIHGMEEHYADILKKGVPIDRDRLKDDANETFRVLNSYISVNRDKLNRTDSYSKVVVERDFIENHYFIMKDMIKAPNVNIQEIIDWLKTQSEALTSMIFEQLPAIFDGYKEKAIRIARDIGRSDPKFLFSIDPISVGPDQRTAIDNSMIHLLRNSLDHGIEKPSDRRAAGKDEQGVITIRTQTAEDSITITLHDDGRGLAIGKLREKGLLNGTINEHSSLDEIAQTIFNPGTSTAHAVSDISGRGIGMNAVQTYMEKVGGTIAIKLGQKNDSSGNYYDFSFEIKLPIGQKHPELYAQHG